MIQSNHILLLLQSDDYYCKDYPVLNYTLVTINNGSLEKRSLLLVSEDSITANNLLENAVYMFRVIASNIVGAVSTSNWTICKLLISKNLNVCSLLNHQFVKQTQLMFNLSVQLC